MADWTVLGERLRLMRRRKGFTQQRLGALVGLSEATINRLEGGQASSIQIGALVLMSERLEVSIDYLLGRSDDPALAWRPAAPSADAGAKDETEDEAPPLIVAVEG